MAGESFTQEQVDAMIAERLAAEVEGLKKNQQEALKEAKAAKAKLAAFEGIDPAEYRTLKEAADDAERKRALAEGNLDAWKKQVTDAHQKEREADAKRLAKYESSLAKRLKQDELRKALVGKADPTMMELLVEHGSKYVHIRETDEDFEQFVADEKGNPLVGDGKGSPMTIDQFVDQNLKTKFPAAFLGTGSSGGGASRSNGGAGGVRTVARDDSRAFIANLEDIAKGKVDVV